jgi:hypothetical protein
MPAIDHPHPSLLFVLNLVYVKAVERERGEK